MTYNDSSPIPFPAPGTRIDNNSLELVDVLEENSVGAVYRAERIDSSPRNEYVVKCFLHPHSSTALQRQIHQEADLHRIASAHDNVITFHQLIEEPNYMYLVTDYAPDHDLFHQMLHGRYLGNNDLIIEVFFQILDAVEHFHERRVYHRDLRPENIFCFDDGFRVGIANFGMATSEEMSKEFFETGNVYMSPECQDGRFSPNGAYSPMHNDIWSLGIILLNLVTGRRPWESASVSDTIFESYCRDPQNFLPTVLPISYEANDILVRMLAVDYRRRMTCPELREALQDLHSFYYEHVVFEGHVALFPREKGKQIDNDLSQIKSAPEITEPNFDRNEFFEEVLESPVVCHATFL
ncbi:hypothetical protein GYMLUDRAFT_157706 [Collybiopsis luxurians FD-317 M1]|nr:hypothetical protein GYMLUDRAFT_157706 [Collybiopsis luxurians FD-317 M1]